MDKNADYATSFVVEQSPEAVFAAVTDPRAWWSEDIEGETGNVGAIFFYHYKDIHRGTFKVTELVPGEKVVWHVVQNYFNFVKEATEWTGTDVVFEIVPADKGTELRFTHVGLKPSEECYDVCNDSWNFYIKASLRNLIANGVGQPNKGDANANPTVVPVSADVDMVEQKTEGVGAEVIVLTTATAKPRAEVRVQNALRDVASAARRQPGCLEYSVLRSDKDRNVTICVERWASEADRETFLRSEDVKTFVSAITGAFVETPKPISYERLEA